MIRASNEEHEMGKQQDPGAQQAQPAPAPDPPPSPETDPHADIERDIQATGSPAPQAQGRDPE